MALLHQWVAALPALLLATLPSVGLPASAQAQATPEPGPGKLVLVLDSSGSMAERTGGGETRIQAAKSALRQVIGSLPEEQEVGLRVYGAEVFSRDQPGACTDSQLVVPVETGNRDELRSALDDYRPHGETPIGHALRQAGEDLGAQGRRNIVLVSDGEPTCPPDPCRVAEDLAAQGIDLRIDVVGLDVDGAAREQLACIARAGNGTYYDAASSAELAASLEKLSTRAARPYTVTGTPVTGTPEAAGAPEVAAGDWADEIAPADAPGSTRHYAVTRTTPGSTLHVSAALRSDAAVDDDGLRLELFSAEDGASCGGSGLTAQRTGGELIAVAASAGALRTGGTLDPEAACATQDLVAVVTRQNGTSQAPLEIRVIEEPPVESVDGLPRPDPSAGWVEPPRGGARPVTGGTSFVDAPVLEPGSYRDSIVPGEVLTYQVDVEWGQRLTAAIDFPRMSGRLADAVTADSPIVATTVHSPARARSSVTGRTDGPGSQVGLTDDGESIGDTIPPVRYLNGAQSEPVSGARLAGRYTVTVFMDASEDGPSYLTPFTVRLGVSGEPGDGPPYVVEPEDPETATPPPAPADPGQQPGAAGEVPGSDEDGGWPLLLGPLAALVVLVAGVMVVRSRRARG